MSPARAPRPPALRYRAARRTDLETLAELGSRAYRVPSLEQRREFYSDHPRFGLRDVRVGELDGRVVASLVLYALEAFVRGHKVPVVGVGSVAVSPEHRRRGVAEALMRAALREMRQQGRALSMLYPFRESFYRKFGYGPAEIAQTLAIAPANLPASEEARRTRRLMLPDRPAVQALYDRVAAAQGHWALARTEAWWERRLWTYPGDWIVYEGRRRGQIEGYLYYEIDHGEGPFKLAMTLREFVAATPEARRGLVGYLQSLSDQVVQIHHVAPADNLWVAQQRDAQNLHPGAEVGLFHDAGNVVCGAMLRVTEPRLALEAIPAPAGAKGELLLELNDAVLPVNTRAYRVSARDGKFHVAPEAGKSGARPRLPRLAAAADTFAMLLSGALSPVRAAESGLATAGAGGAEVAEGWFRARPAYLHPLNAF